MRYRAVSFILDSDAFGIADRVGSRSLVHPEPRETQASVDAIAAVSRALRAFCTLASVFM